MGGVSPYHVSLVSGTLPSGLTLDQYGDIYGEITSSASESFTTQATDSSVPAQSASRQFTIHVTPAPRLVLSKKVPKVTEGQYYDQAIKLTGGVSPYSWTIVSGQLPTGLSFSDGQIYGEATKQGSQSIVVSVVDSATPSHKATAKIKVSVGPAPKLKIETKKLSVAKVGVYYYAVLTASGGVPTYSWTITKGVAPPGITFDSSGEIYGMPTKKGHYKLTVTVSDSATPSPHRASKAYAFAVS